MQAKIADQRRLEAEIVTKRADAQQVIDQSSEVQRQFYDLGTEIARIEESIQYQSERAQALNEDIKAGEEELTETRARLTTDQAELSRLTAELEALGPRIEAVNVPLKLSEALAAAEQALRAAERDWDRLLGRRARQGKQEKSRSRKSQCRRFHRPAYWATIS